eukprot:gb/GEZN01013259.1/.p1 GENE.gb/GEZN01013259.1/~~gb/GEZN01013259.1/.p1  ORF type:complete len:155 (+),score=38.42 gb/GEZN01013259.1/:552-1016(+)
MRVYGDASYLESSRKNLTRAGQQVGIKFLHDNDKMLFPTIRAHRLVEWATRQGKQDEVMETLFKMYFEEGKSLYDIKDLVECAGRIGLKDAKPYLESTQDEAEVYAMAKRNQRDIRGVPHFTLSVPGKSTQVELSGAQPPDRFMSVISQLLSLK